MNDVFVWTGFIVLMAVLLLLFLFVALKILAVVGRIMRQSKVIHFGAISIWEGRRRPEKAYRIVIDYIRQVKTDNLYLDYEMKQAIRKAAEAIREVEG